eukprot:CAMPEP_0197587354 /NCGR_PEP_ID=MMETSP1326-20131121/9009_1 /TAXON_ID=1155430 /ORGANISM="Genus nov. species nov., Strain RCC2288" /LENGTH=260 /DNA_ID=CAMNT_0043152073 /DNA_START=62 /DNA_END=844 /DNA_ORIENTATION=-
MTVQAAEGPAEGVETLTTELTADAACEATTTIDILPAEILYKVLSLLPTNAATANSLASVCTTWRQAILSDALYLHEVRFKLNVNQPFRGLDLEQLIPGWKHAVENFNLSPFHKRFNDRDFPKVLSAAAAAANVTALETLAALKEVQGDGTGSYKHWKKAAVLGSARGQFKIGESFYKGSGTQGVDGEEALFWLTRAVKNPALPPELLATAAGIMGFLHLDGEGTQANNVTAVKWFKVAAEAGNLEATKTLGWLYNTGQY